MKRIHYSQDSLLRLIGAVAKFLFAGMFICTVACLLAAAFGVPEIALEFYKIIWSLFWRVGLTLLCLVSVVITLEAL